MKFNRVFYFILTLIFSAALMVSCAQPAPNHQPAKFRKEPYLIFTAQSTSMTVMWQADSTPQKAEIAWGKTEACQDGMAEVKENKAAENEHLFSYTLTGLQPAQRTYYCVSMEGTLLKGSFRTAPAQDASAVTLYAHSDTQMNVANHDALSAAILADIQQNPDERQTILLHGGDFVAHGLYELDWDIEFFNRAYRSAVSLLSIMPVVAAMGNHETYAQEDYAKVCDFAGTVFRKYFPYPMYATPKHYYYSFDYGPVHITMVDPYTADYRRDTGEEYLWLKADLAKPAQYKVIVMHQPAWSYRLGAYSLRQELHPLFLENGVDLVIQGHEHYYARLIVDGIQYITTGGGGGSLSYPDKYNANITTPADWMVMSQCEPVAFDPVPDIPVVDLVDPHTAARGNHFIRLEFKESGYQGIAIDKDGKVLDCFPEACKP